MEQLQRYRWALTVGLVLLAGVAGRLLWRPAAPAPPPVSAVAVYTPTPLPTEIPPPTPTLPPIQVYVCGAVSYPGVYALPAGARVVDALQAAGGADEEADLSQVNLARRVRDEEQIYIPCRGEPTRAIPGADSPPTPVGAAPQPAKVDINTAGLAELDGLPGIGPGYAQRIVDYRTSHGPFRSTDEIQNVPGIGPTTYSRIKDLIVVQ